MANKAKKAKRSSAKPSSDENVVRIRANSAPTSKKEDIVESASQRSETKVVASKTPKEKPAKAVKAEKVKTPRPKRSGRGSGVLHAITGYFKGAWFELRQVRWPNRRATWGMTVAVILYSAFFVILILALDALFKYLFDLILKK